MAKINLISFVLFKSKGIKINIKNYMLLLSKIRKQKKASKPKPLSQKSFRGLQR